MAAKEKRQSGKGRKRSVRSIVSTTEIVKVPLPRVPTRTEIVKVPIPRVTGETEQARAARKQNAAPERAPRTRLTLNVPTDVLKAAKHFAVDAERDLQDVLTDALRMFLATKPGR